MPYIQRLQFRTGFASICEDLKIKICIMNAIKDLLTTPELTTSSTSGRVISVLSGLAIIGLAMMDKKQSTLSKWVKIGSGAVLILQAASGIRPGKNAHALKSAVQNLTN
jgi:hypothetical protein